MTGTLTETDYTVMLVLLLLLSAVGLVWLGAFLQKRNERPASEVSDAATGAKPTTVGKAQLPPTTAEQIVKRMEQHLSDLQKQLNMDLAQLQASMQADRLDTERHVVRVRELATEHRLTLTLFELFESLKTLPKKNQEAQSMDRAWHGQVGIEPDDVLLPNEDSDPWKIYFKLEGIWYLLRVLERKYSRIDYMRSLCTMRTGGCLPKCGPGLIRVARSLIKILFRVCTSVLGFRSSSHCVCGWITGCKEH